MFTYTCNKKKYKEIIKCLNFQLTKNFFTLDEFSNLSFRNAYKVIKLISKINKIKLKRKEIKHITSLILNIAIRKTTTIQQIEIISPLFKWKVNFIQNTISSIVIFTQYVISYIFIFRIERKKILRI